MDLERARFNMVEQQIRTWEVLDQDVLDLLYVVRREEFVPAAYKGLAFSDLEIPLAAETLKKFGATSPLPYAKRSEHKTVPTFSNAGPSEHMLQPKLEARILQEVAPKRTERVLEIGTGSGYMAALLAAKSATVTTLEINPALAAIARRNLEQAGIANVTVETADGALGWARQAPYDVIVVSASAPLLPQSWLQQLKAGGRLFAVIGDPPVMAARLVTCLASGAFDSIDLFETSIAPLANAPQPKRFSF